MKLLDEYVIQDALGMRMCLVVRDDDTKQCYLYIGLKEFALISRDHAPFILRQYGELFE